MTVGELKEKIKDLPDHMEVVIQQENTEFQLSHAQVGLVVTAKYSEEPGGKLMAKAEVFLISDES